MPLRTSLGGRIDLWTLGHFPSPEPGLPERDLPDSPCQVRIGSTTLNLRARLLTLFLPGSVERLAIAPSSAARPDSADPEIGRNQSREEWVKKRFEQEAAARGISLRKNLRRRPTILAEWWGDESPWWGRSAGVESFSFDPDEIEKLRFDRPAGRGAILQLASVGWRVHAARSNDDPLPVVTERLLRGVAHGDVGSVDAEVRRALGEVWAEKGHRKAGRATTAMGRFASFVVSAGACELWTGAKKNGYGQFKTASGKTVQAHRWHYEQETGRGLSRGVVLRQSCGNRGCVALLHLYEDRNEGSATARPVNRGFLRGQVIIATKEQRGLLGRPSSPRVARSQRANAREIPMQPAYG
jgi:hypothetical protein